MQPSMNGQTSLVAVTTEQGYPLFRAQGTACRGWVKVKNGDATEGISLLRSGSAGYRASGAEAWTPYHPTYPRFPGRWA
jgi:hypothetical protein